MDRRRFRPSSNNVLLIPIASRPVISTTIGTGDIRRKFKWDEP
jgi:hypothetical protein